LLQFDLVLALLDNMRAEIIDGLARPSNPTEFGFGTLHGQLSAVETMRERLTDAVEQRDEDAE
jgi:hypothetical protein